MSTNTRRTPASANQTAVQRAAIRARRDGLRELGVEIRRRREDVGLSQRRIAAVAGISQGLLSEIEGATAGASLDTLFRIAAALGGRLSLQLWPGTGPAIRDHLQARMVEGVLTSLDGRWQPRPEVPVFRPVRGTIDLVLHDASSGIVIAAEFHSQLRRLEQQIRWANEKAAALMPSGSLPEVSAAPGDVHVSSMLVLRSTRANRDVAARFGATLKAAYPGHTKAAVRSLTGGETPWPGSTIVWMSIEDGGARILGGPARGVAVGR